MAVRRRIDADAGRAAVRAWQGGADDRTTVATAVRYLLEQLATDHEGNSVEVRVPPFGATQAIEGPRHTRGTPPNVVETDAQTWLGLATGRLDWVTALADARVSASGTRADLAPVLPVRWE
ncbi:sterol carrier family protein [Protaetiibacter mangrovi]|uniref:Sterol carrier family protein n=1 Tax=Protaetiibacter mangrovi TaxID=2970926 RepID=A0ABT1ZCK7_9MICO|nr:sterol carrier family protein [Protaetiibacter mangrovi]MCS0498429.1 sterol carrier family protein [Protaetiibacter mangrovi]